MKAAVRDRYGSADVVRVQDLPTPVPGGDEVLVRVHAAVVGVVDSVAREGVPRYARVYFGLLRPRSPLLGSDFAGRVEAIGPAVTRFAVGDEVFGSLAPRFGAHAEYVCLSQDAALAPKPARLTFPEAAALVDTTALVFLRDKARLVRAQPQSATPRRRVPHDRAVPGDPAPDGMDGPVRDPQGDGRVHRPARRGRAPL